MIKQKDFFLSNQLAQKPFLIIPQYGLIYKYP